MNDKQREDRILKFAGFRYSHTATVKNMITGTWGSDVEFFVAPDGVVMPTPPIDLNFFGRWVFPKLLYYSVESHNDRMVSVTLRNLMGDYYHSDGANLLDSLISALEKLIDGEEGK
jgi:hypothetical protein